MTAEAEPRVNNGDIDAMVAAEMKRLREQGQLEVQVEHRCRACQDEPTRMLINNLLARMLSYRDIFQIINVSINPVRKQQGLRPITQRIITHHAKEHFAIDNPAWAVFRAIGERRGKQLGRDYENGIAETVSYLAYLETMVKRGWDDLIDPDTKVTYVDGARAAKDLADIETKSSGQQQQAEMLAQMNRIITIFKEVVPADQWPAVVARINGEAIPAQHAIA